MPRIKQTMDSKISHIFCAFDQIGDGNVQHVPGSSLPKGLGREIHDELWFCF